MFYHFSFIRYLQHDQSEKNSFVISVAATGWHRIIHIYYEPNFAFTCGSLPSWANLPILRFLKWFLCLPDFFPLLSHTNYRCGLSPHLI